MRKVAVLLALVGVLSPVSPASAELGVVAVTGSVHFDCYGCPGTYGTMDLAGIGSVSGSAHGDFVQSGGTCPVSGNVDGTMTGAINLSFHWTTVGAVVLMVTAGEFNGMGVATLAITSTVGNPCGARNVYAEIAGVIAGT